MGAIPLIDTPIVRHMSGVEIPSIYTKVRKIASSF